MCDRCVRGIFDLVKKIAPFLHCLVALIHVTVCPVRAVSLCLHRCVRNAMQYGHSEDPTIKTLVDTAPYEAYLLTSIAKEKHGRCYIGTTNNFRRRLRQHNGVVTGGARRTSKLRPLETVLTVAGFLSATDALQFEWHWQHPGRSTLARPFIKLYRVRPTPGSFTRKLPRRIANTQCALQILYILVEVWRIRRDTPLQITWNPVQRDQWHERSLFGSHTLVREES